MPESVKVQALLPAALVERLDAAAGASNVSRSAMCRIILSRVLEPINERKTVEADRAA